MDILDQNFFKIETNNVKPAQGKVLISEPFLEDGIFYRSVVLLTRYSPEDGAMGFVLNKLLPKKYYPKEIEKEFPNIELSLAYGGPVEMEKMFYIHNLSEKKLPFSIEIMPGLYWGGDFNVLKRKINEGEISPSQVRFFVGYSGWAPKQLENELANNSWIVGNITPEEVLNPDENLWRKILNKFNLKYRIWATYPEKPFLN